MRSAASARARAGSSTPGQEITRGTPSTASQVPETARKHFFGQTGLFLVAVDADALGDALRWEPSRNDELFPHLYGALALDCVLWVKPLPLGADGRHAFPELAP